MNIVKYNQNLLAVLGTLVCLGLVILIIGGIISFFALRIGNNNFTQEESGIVIDQHQVIDTTEFSFSQEISILKPFQLDTSEPVFIIPIGQKDKRSKRYPVAAAGMGFKSYSSKDYYFSSFRGLYNNFVLIDYNRNIKVPVFKSKIAITDWAYMKIKKSQLILFKGTDEDSNLDGRLNNDDFQSLFVYNVNTLETKVLKFKNETVREFEPLEQTSMIYVRTGKDINNDKEFVFSKEPTDLYFYDVATGESETLVPDNIKQKIQEILNK